MAPAPFSPESWDKMLAYITRRVKCESTAQDIAHDAYVVALTSGNLRIAYVWGVAKYKILEHRRYCERTRKAAREYKGAYAASCPWSLAEKEHLHSALDSAVGRLPEAAQKILDQVMNDGQSLKEVAASGNSSHAATRQSMTRIRKALRAALLPLLAVVLISSVAWLWRSLDEEQDQLAPRVASLLPETPPAVAVGPIRVPQASARHVNTPALSLSSLPRLSPPPSFEHAPSPSPSLEWSQDVAQPHIVRSLDRVRKAAGKKVTELCQLSPSSSLASGRICVEFIIDGHGKPTSSSVDVVKPSKLTLADPGIADCVKRVAQAHIDLRHLTPIPPKFNQCFRVKRQQP